MRQKRKVFNIAHYVFKYVLLLVPLILLLISYVLPNKKIENEYKLTETTTQVNYKYQTNEVNSVSDVIDGNIYFITLLWQDIQDIDDSFNYNFSYGTTLLFDVYQFFEFAPYTMFDYDIEIFDYECNFVYSLTNGYGLLYLNFYSTQLKLGDSDDGLSLYITFIGFVHNLSNLTNFTNFTISACPLEYIPKEETIINNTYDSSSLVNVEENREANYSLLEPLENLYQLSINSWYTDLLDIIGIDSDNRVTMYLAYYPLYVMYVELFYLIALVLSFIPRLFNKWLGDKDNE